MTRPKLKVGLWYGLGVRALAASNQWLHHKPANAVDSRSPSLQDIVKAGH